MIIINRFGSISPTFLHMNYANYSKITSNYANFSTSPKSASSRLSYAYGTSDSPLLYKTMGQVLQEQTEKHSDKHAFIVPYQGIRKTYANFHKDVHRFANGLIALGLERGDRIGMWGPNSYEWVVSQFASAVAGLVLVTINPAYSARELEYCLNKAGVKCLVSASSFKRRQYYDVLCEFLPGLPIPTNGTLSFGNIPNLTSIVHLSEESKPGTYTYEEVCEMGDQGSKVKLDKIRSQVQPDDPVNIQFTSGTTGKPKGATLSHFNIVNNAYFVGRRLGYHQHETTLCLVPPLYHCLGCVLGSLNSVVHGASCVLPSAGFDAKAALKAIHDEKCTSVYGTPTMYIDMLNDRSFGEYDFSSLRTGIATGSPCPSDLCQDIVDRMGPEELTIVYGTTENSPATFTTLRHVPVKRRMTSVGHVLDHTEAKVVDDRGHVVSANQRGELWIRGYCLMLNYWNDPEKTAEVIGPDKWYKTGDLAEMDESGCVKIVGRKKDLIIRGGENIYPAEIEEFLHTFDHDRILDVQVFGVPDQRLGEQVCAWIRLKNGKTCTDEEIRRFCMGKIADYKIPRYIVFKKEEDFPITVTGKIEKYKMRQMATEELNLNTD